MFADTKDPFMNSPHVFLELHWHFKESIIKIENNRIEIQLLIRMLIKIGTSFNTELLIWQRIYIYWQESLRSVLKANTKCSIKGISVHSQKEDISLDSRSQVPASVRGHVFPQIFHSNTGLSFPFFQVQFPKSLGREGNRSPISYVRNTSLCQ